MCLSFLFCVVFVFVLVAGCVCFCFLFVVAVRVCFFFFFACGLSMMKALQALEFLRLNYTARKRQRQRTDLEDAGVSQRTEGRR